MRLPRPDAPYETRVEFAAYVGARLKAGQQEALAVTVKDATRVVKERGRALDDLEEPLQDAIAQRDACDDFLDEVAQVARKKIASASLDAEKKAPYTNIFPKGIAYYTAAPLEKEVEVYSELAKRLGEHLGSSDPLGKDAIAAINNGLERWRGLEAKVNEQRNAVALARTRLEAAEEDWGRVLGRVYGTLYADLGRKKAEQFFPRRTRRTSGNEDVGGTGTEVVDAEE